MAREACLRFSPMAESLQLDAVLDPSKTVNPTEQCNNFDGSNSAVGKDGTEAALV